MTQGYEETIVGGQPRSVPMQEIPTEMVRSGSAQPPVSPGPISSARTEIIGGPPSSFAWLVIRNGARAGQIFRLSTEGTSIGRDTQCDVILDDDAVSRQHAKLRVERNSDGEPQFFVYDLATSNGTRVNEQRIVKQPLSDGDVIEIGRTKLVFKKV